MITKHHECKILVNSKTGEYWGRDGRYTPEIEEAYLKPFQDYNGPPSWVHRDLVYGTVNIEVRYYEYRENESKSNEKDSR